jgi:hypothetical protein
MICYNVCPNCGQYMYEDRCQAVCMNCGVFFDCEDLFPYDEVITSAGLHYLIAVDGGSGGIEYNLKARI